MSDQPQDDKTEKLKREYANLCAGAGEAQYKISQLEKSLRKLYKELKDMNYKIEMINKRYVAEQNKTQHVITPEDKAALENGDTDVSSTEN